MHPHPRNPRFRRAAVAVPITTAALITSAAFAVPVEAAHPANTTHRSGAGTASADAHANAGGLGRPFKPGSYWNTPLGHAPVNPHNREYIRDSQAHSQHYLKLILGSYAMPVFHSSASDPLYRVGGVRVHIPRRAHAMHNSDAAMVVLDRATHQVVGLYGAHFSGSNWSGSVSRYRSGTNGIAGGLPTGSKANFGHRGIPGSVQAVTKAEIRHGAIRHRLEVFWHQTSSGRPYFPMTNSESGKSGVVPEGTVIRIKQSVNLRAMHLSRAAYIVARALQRYGAVIGDNAGSGNCLKLQANTRWRGILNQHSLHKIKWHDYVFVKGGYRP